jgi:hypothetical protein
MSPLNIRAIPRGPLINLRQPSPVLLPLTTSRTRGRAGFYRAAQVFLQPPSKLPRCGCEKPLAPRGCPAAEAIEDRRISQPLQRSSVDHTNGMTRINSRPSDRIFPRRVQVNGEPKMDLICVFVASGFGREISRTISGTCTIVAQIVQSSVQDEDAQSLPGAG